MAQRICVLTPREGELLRSGLLTPSACRNHRHIDYGDAALLANGAETIKRRDYDRMEPIGEDASGRVCTWADWGELAHADDAEPVGDIKARLRVSGFGRMAIVHELQRLGRLSTRHIVLHMAKEWTASQSWRPIGAEGRIKHGKTRCIRTMSYSLTQCADNNEPLPARG